MKISFWLLAAAAVLSACAVPTPTSTSVPNPTTVPVKTDFTPSDPKTVNLAAGQPQLVEFYAVW